MGFSQKRFLIVFTSIFLTFYISSCSRTQMFYTFADWTLMNRIDRFFDLTPGQEKFLNEKIDALLNWHRKEELPKIRDFLTNALLRFQDRLSREDIDLIIDGYKVLWARLMEKALPDFAEFLITVDETQIEHLIPQLARRNQFLIDQLEMSDEELLDDQQTWLIDQMEDWFGNLDSLQKEKIAAQIKPDKGWIQSRIRERTRFNNEFVSWLKARKTNIELETSLTPWVIDPNRVWSPEFREQANKRREMWIEKVLLIDSIITIDQRTHFQNKIQNYIDEINALVKSQV